MQRIPESCQPAQILRSRLPRQKRVMQMVRHHYSDTVSVKCAWVRRKNASFCQSVSSSSNRPSKHAYRPLLRRKIAALARPPLPLPKNPYIRSHMLNPCESTNGACPVPHMPFQMSEKPDGPDGDATILAKPKTKTQRPPMYKVLILNDDYTPMEFVVHIFPLVPSNLPVSKLYLSFEKS